MTAQEPSPAEPFRDLHDSAVVFDGSMVVELSDAHIERMRAGGVTAVNHTVSHPYADTRTALAQINETRRWIDEHPGSVTLAHTPDEIRAAKAAGKEAIVFGPQDTEMIGGDLDLLGTFYDLGVRILQLTYQRQNLVGTGCGEAVDGGLTAYGREFVAEMNRLGILVDVSHCGQLTGYGAMDASERPVIVSHSFANALSPHMRAKDDDFIRALAAQGGVIGITTLSGFLYYPEDRKRHPDLKRFVEHVSHVVDIAGIDAVAIATDYEETLYEDAYTASHVPALVGGWDYAHRRAIGMEDGSRFGNFTTALKEGGFDDDEVRKILGENWLRALAAAQS